MVLIVKRKIIKKKNKKISSFIFSKLFPVEVDTAKLAFELEVEEISF
jgi:hypothetical protein